MSFLARFVVGQESLEYYARRGVKNPQRLGGNPKRGARRERGGAVINCTNAVSQRTREDRWITWNTEVESVEQIATITRQCVAKKRKKYRKTSRFHRQRNKKHVFFRTLCWFGTGVFDFCLNMQWTRTISTQLVGTIEDQNKIKKWRGEHNDQTFSQSVRYLSIKNIATKVV